MVGLKQLLRAKLKASSLTEVIVATTVLLVLFGLALLTLNNIMVSSVRKNTLQMQMELEQLIYQYENGKLNIPYNLSQDGKMITAQQIEDNQIKWIEFSIQQKSKGKTVEKRMLKISYDEK